MKDLDLEINEKEVIVLQMGKVASTAIVNSIAKCGIKVSQPHFLTMESFLTLIRRFEDPDLLPFTAKHTLGQIQANIVIHNRVQKQKKYRYKDADGSNRMKIITLAREPLAWYLSNLSQNYEEYADDVEQIAAFLQNAGRGKAQSDLGAKIAFFIAELARFFDANVTQINSHTIGRLAQCANANDPRERGRQEILIKHSVILLRPMAWFGYHFDPIIGTTPETLTFDPEKGFGVTWGDCFDILVLRFEDLRRIGESTIGQFLNLNTFKLKEHNVSRDKKIGSIVIDAINDVRFPGSFLDKMFTNEYCAKFYTPKQLSELKTKYQS